MKPIVIDVKGTVNKFQIVFVGEKNGQHFARIGGAVTKQGVALRAMIGLDTDHKLKVGDSIELVQELLKWGY